MLSTRRNVLRDRLESDFRASSDAMKTGERKGYFHGSSTASVLSLAMIDLEAGRTGQLPRSMENHGQ